MITQAPNDCQIRFKKSVDTAPFNEKIVNKNGPRHPPTEYRPIEELNASLSQPLIYLEDQIMRYKHKLPEEVFIKLQNESQIKFQNQLKKVLKINKGD